MKLKQISMAVAAIVVSASASAQWAVYDAQVARGVQSVVDALRNSGQANSAVQSKATEQIANAVNDAQATEAMRRAERDYQIQDACGAIAGTRGLSDAARINDPRVGASITRVGGGGGRITSAPSGASSAMSKAIEIAANASAAPPVSLQAELAVEGACSTFVEPASVRGQACINSGQKNTGAKFGLQPDADINPATLFKGAPRAGEAPRNKLTLIADDKEPEWYALRALRRNLTIPLDLRALSSAELVSNPGKQYTALRDAFEARMGMANAPLHAFVENRTANVVNAGVVDQMLNSPVSAAYVQAYLDANKLTSWKTRGLSRDEVMNLEVERRYMNLEWHKNLASQPGDPVLKELVVMAAHDKVMMWRLIQQVSEMNVTMGQIAGTLNRMEMTPQLNTLHSAATSANR